MGVGGEGEGEGGIPEKVEVLTGISASRLVRGLL